MGGSGEAECKKSGLGCCLYKGEKGNDMESYFRAIKENIHVSLYIFCSLSVDLYLFVCAFVSLKVVY